MQQSLYHHVVQHHPTSTQRSADDIRIVLEIDAFDHNCGTGWDDVGMLIAIARHV